MKRLIAKVLGLSLVAACNNGSSGSSGAQGTPPPPPPPPSAAAANPCAGGGDTIHDAVAAPLFPKTVGAWCIRGDATAYGDKAAAPIDHLSEAIDGECAEYDDHKVTRYVALKYATAGGDDVNVILSTYPDAAHAYSMFTARVLSGGTDPLAVTGKPLAAGGAGIIGGGNANVWKGQYLVELTYNTDDTSKTPAQIVAASQAALPPIANAIAAALPGTNDPPPSVKALPANGLIPLGVDVPGKDAFGAKGFFGPAIGHYKDGDKRWIQIAFVGDSAAQATSAVQSMKAIGSPRPVAGLGDEAWDVKLLAVDILFARKGNVVEGVGDDSFASTGDAAKISEDDKTAKLKAWLAAPAAAAPSASASAKKP